MAHDKLSYEDAKKIVESMYFSHPAGEKRAHLLGILQAYKRNGISERELRTLSNNLRTTSGDGIGRPSVDRFRDKVDKFRRQEDSDKDSEDEE